MGLNGVGFRRQLNVVKKLLQVDADKRITAKELLKHDWLSDIDNIQETVLACGTRRNSDPETKRAAAVAVGLLYNEVEVIGGIVFNKNAQVPLDRKFKLQKDRAIIRMKNPIARRSTRVYQREVQEKRGGTGGGGGGGYAFLEARDL